ncbi:MAG: hypothetical protein ACH344_10830 [Yersinia sp. (in: enterobacteria)]
MINRWSRKSFHVIPLSFFAETSSIHYRTIADGKNMWIKNTLPRGHNLSLSQANSETGHHDAITTQRVNSA